MNVAAPSMVPTHNHNVALDMVDRGIRVFPCWEISVPGHKIKSPRNAGGHLRATLDRAQINSWWTQWPEALVGIDLASAGLFAIDPDRHGGPDGVAAWEEIARLFGGVGPEIIPYVRTPSGGFHIYFRRPKGMDLSNQTGGLPGGIDVRAAGYTIAPGSVMPDGRTYEPVDGSPALSLDIAYAPDWLIDLIGSSGPPSLHSAEPLVSLDGEVEIQLASALLEAHKGAVEGEGGDAATYALACRLRALGVSEARCCELMTGDWNNRCSPPWHPDDLERIVGNAYRYGQGAPGAQSPRLDFADVKPLPAPRTTATPTITATPYVWRDPATIPPRSWVYGRYLLRGTVTAFVAPGGIGKSTFVASTALSLVTGRPLMGKTVWGGSKRVWIWNLEDDLDELSRGIQAAAKHFAIPQDDLNSNLFVDSAMDGSPLCTAVELNGQFKLLQPVYDAIVAELLARRIDVLIIDPFVSSHEVEENANSKIDKIAKEWGRVAKAANCAIVLVHHTSKAGAAEVTVNSARGASALTNACRSALVFNRMDEADAKKFGIDGDDERRRYFRVQDDKHNRAPPEKADWYRLIPVDLGNGPSGRGDSVGVTEPWSPPEAIDGLGPDDLRRVQDAIAAGSWRQSPQSPDWVGHAVAQVLDLETVSPFDKSRIQGLLKTWIREGWLKITLHRDDKRNLRPCIEVAVWQNDHGASPPAGGAGQGEAPEAL